MSIFRNVIGVLVVLGLVGVFLFGDNLLSVMQTSVERARSAVGAELSPGFRLDQAAGALREADQEVQEQRRRVAELKVSCEDLTGEVELLDDQLTSAKGTFRRADEAYARTGGGIRTVSLGGSEFNAPEIRSELERAALQVRATQSKIDTRKRLKGLRVKAYEQAEHHMFEIQKRRDRVALAIETSRIDLESVRLLQSAVGQDVAASSLADAEVLTKQIAKELRVDRELAMMGYDGRAVAAYLDTDLDAAVAEVRVELSGGRLATLN